MESLPDELLFMILSRLPLSDIVERCASTDQRMVQICQSEYLWSSLTLRDFPHEYSLNPGISWRDYYYEVLNSPILPIYLYQDPIEWVRLTPYNLDKVIRVIQRFLQSLGIPDQTIVFSHDTFPEAYFADGIYRIVERTGERFPVNRIVLLPPGTGVSHFEVWKALATPTPGSNDGPLYGAIEDDEFFIDFVIPRHKYDVNEVPCLELPIEYLMDISTELGLEDLDWTEANRPAICSAIEDRLRSMGRLTSEVVPPKKPLLE